MYNRGPNFLSNPMQNNAAWSYNYSYPQNNSHNQQYLNSTTNGDQQSSWHYPHPPAPHLLHDYNSFNMMNQTSHVVQGAHQQQLSQNLQQLPSHLQHQNPAILHNIPNQIIPVFPSNQEPVDVLVKKEPSCLLSPTNTITTSSSMSSPEDRSSSVNNSPTSSVNLKPPNQARSPFEWMKKPSFNNQPQTGKTRTKDKYRAVYNDHQRLELEKEYYLNKYITIRRKSDLSLMLNLSERQVKIWFQNRRAKDRKLSKKNNEMNVSNVRNNMSVTSIMNEINMMHTQAPHQLPPNTF